VNILKEIAFRRLKDIAKYGHEMGAEVPEKRDVPLIPFANERFLVCEVKRSSPSRGAIAENISAIKKAEEYIRFGASRISVLTEKNYFSGSLDDLVGVKRSSPSAAVLRKDFLLDTEDIDVSYRAGADAVLLIAAMLTVEQLDKLYQRASRLGLEALVEVHSSDDITKARKIKPALTGINSRNLSNFKIDTMRPLKLKKKIDWKTKLIFESGIKSEEDALIAFAAGFSGILVGEAVVRNPRLIARITSGYSDGYSDSANNFWGRLFEKKRETVPLVKVCGITQEKDARMIADEGADILGFVFAPSKRKANKALLKRIRDLSVLKAAVVVSGFSEVQGGKYQFNESIGDVKELLDEGLIDAVQFHGNEEPESCSEVAFPYYKAVRVRGISDVERMVSYRCPRVLADAYSEKAVGGTGERLANSKILSIKKKYPLWLAGGINPDNVRGIIRKYDPELIDLSSGVEMKPGEKDPEKIKKLFSEVNRSI